MEVEKVAVLCCRNLQLRRIAGLQDELLQLATTSTNVETTSGAKVQEDTKAIDTVLSAYGRDHPRILYLFSLTVSSRGSSQLRDAFFECSDKNSAWR